MALITSVLSWLCPLSGICYKTVYISQQFIYLHMVVILRADIDLLYDVVAAVAAVELVGLAPLP